MADDDIAIARHPSFRARVDVPHRIPRLHRHLLPAEPPAGHFGPIGQGDHARRRSQGGSGHERERRHQRTPTPRRPPKRQTTKPEDGQAEADPTKAMTTAEPPADAGLSPLVRKKINKLLTQRQGTARRTSRAGNSRALRPAAEIGAQLRQFRAAKTTCPATTSRQVLTAMAALRRGDYAGVLRRRRQADAHRPRNISVTPSLPTCVRRVQQGQMTEATATAVRAPAHGSAAVPKSPVRLSSRPMPSERRP